VPGETLCRAASGDQVPSQTLVVLDENLMVGRVAEAAISPSMTGVSVCFWQGCRWRLRRLP
jgi:hypothetical protein